MSDPVTLRIPRRALSFAVVALATAAIVIPATAWASARFTDVPDDNTFSRDIDWLADAGVTKGCNPPDNTRFCPKEDVTREQMAAFMRRLSEGRVVDAGTVDGIDGSNIARSDRFYTIDGPPTESEMVEENVYIGALLCDPGDIAISAGYLEDVDQYVWATITADDGTVAAWEDGGTSGGSDLEMTARCLDLDGPASSSSEDRTRGASIDQLMEQLSEARS